MVQVRKKRGQKLANWLESVVKLPSAIASEPGNLHLHPYQRAIADAIGDPRIERVSCIKSARIGWTTLLTGGIAHFIVRDPAPILVVMPTASDARGLVVDDIEGVFQESTEISSYLPMPRPGQNDRNTLTHRLFEGGSLKAVHAGAPRNFRRHSARVLMIDEIDGCQVSAEGDITALAIQRTMSWPNRKIICGGTPLDMQTSTIARLYAESSQNIWELPCPSCGSFHEIRWEQIEWPAGRPEEAKWKCDSCEDLIDEKHKKEMSRKGQWRALNPDAAPRHVGFKINSLSSMLPNAAWGKLAAEYLLAKDDPALLRVFHNTVLGLPWQEEGDEIDDDALRNRAEAFSLDAIPAECMYLTMGIDCADDRLELVICGWSQHECFVLDHQVLWGSVDDDHLWQQLDDLLRQRYKHPEGGTIGFDAVAIDGGDGGHLDSVSSFARKRAGRRVMTIKGAAGFARPAIQASKSKLRNGARLWIVGVDSLKSRIFSQLTRGSSIRFSETLEGVFYEQLASERKITRIVRGKPVSRFERMKGCKAECLDALVYATAARAALILNDATFEQRFHDLKSTPPGEQPVKKPIRYAEDTWLAAPRGNLRGDPGW